MRSTRGRSEAIPAGRPDRREPARPDQGDRLAPGPAFPELLPRRIRMLDPSARLRPASGHDRRDETRPARRRRLCPAPPDRHPIGPRGDSLAPDRADPQSVRLLQRPADAPGRPRGGHPGHLGRHALRLAGRRRYFQPGVHRAFRPPRPPVRPVPGRRGGTHALDRADQRDLLPVLDRRRGRPDQPLRAIAGLRAEDPARAREPGGHPRGPGRDPHRPVRAGRADLPRDRRSGPAGRGPGRRGLPPRAVSGLGHALRTPPPRARRPARGPRRHRGELLSLEPVDLSGPVRAGGKHRPRSRGVSPLPRDAPRELRPLPPAPARGGDRHRGYERATWLRRVGDEVHAALVAGTGVVGLCLYPIVDFPGWDNDRHCQNGLWDYPDEAGNRPIHAPLALELARQQLRLDRLVRS